MEGKIIMNTSDKDYRERERGGEGDVNTDCINCAEYICGPILQMLFYDRNLQL